MPLPLELIVVTCECAGEDVAVAGLMAGYGRLLFDFPLPLNEIPPLLVKYIEPLVTCFPLGATNVLPLYPFPLPLDLPLIPCLPLYPNTLPFPPVGVESAK